MWTDKKEFQNLDRFKLTKITNMAKPKNYIRPIDMKQEKTDITPEQAAEVLQKIEQAKFEACQKELSEVLAKHGYQISVQAQPILVPVQK